MRPLSGDVYDARSRRAAERDARRNGTPLWRFHCHCGSKGFVALDPFTREVSCLEGHPLGLDSLTEEEVPDER